MGRWGTARRSGADRPAGDPELAARASRDGAHDGRPRDEPPDPLGHAVVVRTAAPGLIERLVITVSGMRQPIVAVLLAISFFTVISGKPFDGLLLVTVATALAWDAGLRGRELVAGPAGQHPLATAARDPDQRSAWRVRSGRPRLRKMTLGMAAAVVYSLTVGSFTRYSWPATAGVVGLGAGVVMVGWGGPTRRRALPGKFARAGVLAWGTVLVAGGLWELGALLGQPNIEQSS